MKKSISFILVLMFILFFDNAIASEKIKVLIVNEYYPNIPSNNEKIEKLGNMKGTLLVMGTKYTGDIEVWKGDNGLYIINELPLEEYIKDVVAAEVSSDWDIEALKAQAVVSRTYALYQKKISGGSLYHIASSVLHQVYKGNNPDARVAFAVEETKGEILTYNNIPIAAFYHSTCGGKTENPEEVFGKSYPYLKSVETKCDLSPYSEWERSMDIKEIEKALNIPLIKNISIASYTSTNRVKELNIITDSGVLKIPSTEFRKAIGWSRLPSTNFSISKDNNTFYFEGKGYGHGVGMCQWCALKMAREGKNYKEILSYFYPGTIIKLYEYR
ncbi:MAG: SpoIID/LytB domain-containing protein [Nitrospirae bacterium]|nr:SpoIID/LytB domain-containing protein [Nitrospirota bacterium]